jgi:GGDEF domain-containing protein
VVVAWERRPEPNGEAVVRVAHRLRALARRSDTLAQPAATEVVVLSPGTGASGAAILATRLAAAVRDATGLPPRTGIRVVEDWPRGGAELGPAILHAARGAVPQPRGT